MEIKKLADIVEWADNQIEEMRIDLAPSLGEEEFKNLGQVKEFEAVKKVVNEAIERHKVYTSALNADIVAKDAKIELMQKELDGRKAGYVALKARMDNVKKELEDTKEALDKTIESWVPLNAHDKVVDDLKDAIKERDNRVAELEKELADCKVKIRHQKENLDGINKTLEIRTKENESLIAVKNNKDREIEAHESENARLSEKIIELKRTIEKCKDYDTSLIDSLRINNDDLKERVSKLREEQKTLVDICNKYKKENGDYAVRVNKLKEELNRVYGVVFAPAHEEDDHGRAGFKRYIEHLIEEEERAVPERFKERLNEEITAIFEKEEETEVNDIPCGEDSIE